MATRARTAGAGLPPSGPARPACAPATATRGPATLPSPPRRSTFRPLQVAKSVRMRDRWFTACQRVENRHGTHASSLPRNARTRFVENATEVAIHGQAQLLQRPILLPAHCTEPADVSNKPAYTPGLEPRRAGWAHRMRSSSSRRTSALRSLISSNHSIMSCASASDSCSTSAPTAYACT